MMSVNTPAYAQNVSSWLLFTRGEERRREDTVFDIDVFSLFGKGFETHQYTIQRALRQVVVEVL